MHPIAKYSVCPCIFNLHFTDGSHVDGVYLAKLPDENKYRYALQVLPDSVKIMDIADDEIIAAIDPRKVSFEC